MSALKASMYSAPATPAADFFPTPRYVVLSVTFALHHSETGVVGYGQLAKALGVEVGDRMATADIRNAVLKVRASKGMLEDSHRYLTEAMRGTKKSELVAIAHDAQRTQTGNDEPDYNRHSCGSFFMNPILTKEQAAKLPEDAPRFDATLPDGTPGVKTSAAWLIDHAGFHKGYKTSGNAAAGLSTMHTLALTNRGGATAADIAELAKTVQDGVERAFGIRLVPEPVVIGMSLKSVSYTHLDVYKRQIVHSSIADGTQSACHRSFACHPCPADVATNHEKRSPCMHDDLTNSCCASRIKGCGRRM